MKTAKQYKFSKNGWSLTTGRFEDASGTQYEVTRTGAIIRLSQKPWRSKAERRQVIKSRRAERLSPATTEDTEQQTEPEFW